MKELVKYGNAPTSLKNNLMKIYFIIIPILFFSLFLKSQEGKSELTSGNESYKLKKYDAAELKYKQALQKRKNYTKANYNLGNAFYRQNKFEDASAQFDAVLTTTSNKDTLSKVYHNMGNSELKQKKYEEAIKSYKTSLKMNSVDEETRYNLAWAQKKLADQQKKDGGGENKDKQDKGDKDQKKDDKRSENKKSEAEKKKEQTEQAQPKMSKEDAQRMLDALKNQERKILQKKKEKDKNQEKLDVEKDW